MGTRSIVEIQTEYQNLCLKAGHLQYQVYTFGKDLDMVNQELRDLNLEAAAIKAQEAKAEAAAPAAAPAPSPSAPPPPGAEPTTFRRPRKKKEQTQ